jgi:type IV pilus assembly protein PilV
MRQTPARIHSRNQGFTLLEILITVVLLTVGVLALSQAFSTTLLTSTDAESVDLGLNIAQAKMEELKNTAFSSLASSGPTADSNFPNFNMTVTVTGADPKQIDVTAAWNVKGGSTSVGLTTLRANY